MGLDGQGHVVTLEITSGVVYRGKLLEGSFSPLLHGTYPSSATIQPGLKKKAN